MMSLSDRNDAENYHVSGLLEIWKSTNPSLNQKGISQCRSPLIFTLHPADLLSYPPYLCHRDKGLYANYRLLADDADFSYISTASPAFGSS